MNNRRFNSGNYLRSLYCNLVIVVAFVVLAVLGLLFLRRELLRDAHRMGTAFAHGYLAEEQNNFTVYQTLLSTGAQAMEERYLTGANHFQMKRWLEMYLRNLDSIAGEGSINAFAVVGDRVLTKDCWIGSSEYDYKKKEWYQLAMEAGGNIIMTDAYIDKRTARPIVTMAKKCKNSGNVLAFDVFPENFDFHEKSFFEMADSGYFLCDSKGTLLYADSILGLTYDGYQSYVADILTKIRNGEMDGYDASVVDTDGRRRGVYYCILDNGWVSVVTVPYETILGRLNGFAFGFIIMVLLLAAGFGIFAVKSCRMSRRMQQAEEAVQVLSQCYGALYRVDFQKEAYEVIKGSSYIRERLPARGKYQDLLQMLEDIIAPEDYQAFLSSFSAENIRRLVQENVRDFQRDFRLLYGHEYRWVNICLLYEDERMTGEAMLCFQELEKKDPEQIYNR